MAATWEFRLRLVRRAWDNAIRSRCVPRLLALLHDPLDRVSYISETLSETTVEDADPWWIREKLSAWLEHLSAAEISTGSMITLLKSWAGFDTQKGQPE
jgi:hypothetical protein